MALIRSKSSEFFPHKTVSSSTRKLQEALYTHLDDLEKRAFIEALGVYGSQRDIFELVNALRKILNTPVKRQLFPLVRQVIRHGDVEAFDLLTRGDNQHSTLPRPCLYKPHSADLNVLKKYKASVRSSATDLYGGSQILPGHQRQRLATAHRPENAAMEKGVPSCDVKHKTMSRRSSKSRNLSDGEIFEIDVGEPDSEDEGFGFTIRGGAEMGVGVYVSSVDNDSPALKKGLHVGDLILEANHISFKDITHEEAAKIIRAARRLQLLVSRVGRIPGSHTVIETYRWTDPKGRPVSPPLEGYGEDGRVEDDGRRRSGSLMLQGSDERKVNIVVQKGHGLGVMLRGGKEYGLGIFISGIDPFSVAENAGLKVGDQILDVNGRSFLDVTHAEAVSHLKRGRHLIITVRDVGKLPFAKTTIDETGWIESTKVDSYAKSLSLSSARKSINGSLIDLDMEQKMSCGSAGKPLTLSSSLPEEQENGYVYEQARLLLNQNEQATLNYYLAEYGKKTISVKGLVHALYELLNTSAKCTLFSHIRTVIHQRDLETFDQLMVKRELDKSLREARVMLAPEVISLGSYDSEDEDVSRDRHKRTLFSQPKTVLRKSQWMDPLQFDQMPPTPAMKHSLMETSGRLSRSTPDLSGRHAQWYTRSRSPHFASSGRMRSVEGVSEGQTAMSLLRWPSREARVLKADGHTGKGRMDDPSDDSGVEIYAHAGNGAAGDATNGEPEYASRYKHRRPIWFLQESTSKGLSDPQQKILHHIQKKNGKGLTTKDNVSATREGSQKSFTLPRPAKFSKNTSNSESKASYQLADHGNQLVHATDAKLRRKEKYHFSEVLRKGHRQFTPSENQERASSKSRGHRSRRNSEHEESARARSRSKSRSRPGTPNGLYNQQSGEKNAAFDSEDIDQVGLNLNQNYKTLKLSLSTQNLAGPSRRGRSPYGSDGEFAGEGSGGSRGSKTTSSSNHANSSSTFNGTPVSPDLHQKRKTDILKGSSPSQSSTSSSIIRQYGRSRVRSPQHQQRRIPTAESLFDPDQTSSLSANQITSYPNPHISTNHNAAFEKDPCDSAANQTSKRSLLSIKKQSSSSQYPSSSNEYSAHKTEGSVSSKYKSPRREKPSGKVKIPLIRISPQTLPRADRAALRQPASGRNTNSDDVNHKSLERVTISEQHVNIGTPLQNSNKGKVNDHKSNIHDSDQGNGSRNPHLSSGRQLLPLPVDNSVSVEGRPPRVESIKKTAMDKYGEIPLDLVYIYRSKPTLGVAIEGGANTRQPLPKVINVQPGGSAYESGGLKVGHIILEVNGQPVVGLAHMDAARLIAEAFKNKSSDRMELLVTEWSDRLLDTIKVDVGLLKV